ncbi:IS1/IS1595 family N-terminal zinc-binding domain-containing protein [Kistimonas scapharcae]|uniref:IS1/IS1595 family N-terminal zinc-binding domain-containing protein n=1 Tax=Kistimonas scapharcae TaxID=1036133 RepID=UPI003CD0643A
MVKNGKAATGHQRYLCRNCNKSFQLRYRHNGYQRGTHDRVASMTMNGSGIRDIGCVLGVSTNAVIAHLKTDATHSYSYPLCERNS